MIRFITIITVASSLIGCKPYLDEKFVDIDSNQTAFVIPYDGANKDSQAKFESVEYLQDKKVATKRVRIPRGYRDAGRFYWDVEPIDLVRVIVVDRTPVSRHWDQSREKGTSTQDDAIYVESQDSIGFGLGINITAAISEPDTATYLYNFPDGQLLSTVIDNDIRTSITDVMSREFGNRELSVCKIEKSVVMEVLRKEVMVAWKEFGITIRTIGLSGGLTYENPQIQGSIDDNYKAEMKIEEMENKKRAQEHENARLLSIEVNSRERAEEFNKAIEAQTAKIELEIRRMEAEANLTRAKKWSGNLPANMMPENSRFLYGIDAK